MDERTRLIQERYLNDSDFNLLILLLKNQIEVARFCNTYADDRMRLEDLIIKLERERKDRAYLD